MCSPKAKCLYLLSLCIATQLVSSCVFEQNTDYDGHDLHLPGFTGVQNVRKVLRWCTHIDGKHLRRLPS
jgi:hypothetical protein